MASRVVKNQVVPDYLAENQEAGLSCDGDQVAEKTKPRPAGRGFMESCFHHSSASLLSLHIGRFWVGTVCDNRFQEPSLTAKMDIKVTERKLINVF